MYTYVRGLFLAKCRASGDSPVRLCVSENLPSLRHIMPSLYPLEKREISMCFFIFLSTLGSHMTVYGNCVRFALKA